MTGASPLADSTKLRWWRRVPPDAVVVGVLVLVWLAFFFPYLAGWQMPPWDFLGGYHTHAAAVFLDGSLVAPPVYMPYGSLGFPTAIALQSSAYYWPLGVLDAAGITYDLSAAASVASFHVLLAGIGTYGLARALRMPSVAAGVAGLSYMLMTGFFSNQEHVDIIRGYAWFPLLLLVVVPRVVRSRWGLIAMPFVVSTFLIGSYPGLIVSGGLVVAATVAAYAVVERGDRWTYLGRLVAGGVVGVGIAQLKFLPLMALGDTVASGTGGTRFSRLAFSHLVTIVAPPSRELLPSDITMQSIFVPVAALFLAVVAVGRKRLLTTAIAVAAMGSIVLMWLPDGARLATRVLAISRFPLADWRMVFAISIALLAAIGIRRVIDRDVGMATLAVMVASTSFLLITVGAAAIVMGYSKKTIGALVLVDLAGIAAVAAASWNWHRHRWSRGVVVGGLAFVALFASGFAYHHAFSLPWMGGNPTEYEIATYGASLDEIMAGPRRTTWPERPERLSLGAGPAEPFQAWKSPKYRAAWYDQTFAALGHDNLKRVVPFNVVVDTALADETGLFWRYLTDRSRVLVFGAGVDPSVGALTECLASAAGTVATTCDGGPEVTVQMTGFRLDGAEYLVSSVEGFTMIENEVYYQGWTSSVCDAAGECVKADDARPGSGHLRAWQVPAGDWSLVTRYVPPARRVSETVAVGAIALWGAMGIVVLRRRRGPG